MQNRNEQSTEILKQAEAIARKETQPSETTVLSPQEILKTVQDLRISQIELEMQNEELRRTQLELETARQRYFDLYDLAPVGYLTLSESGLILEANLAAASMVDLPRKMLVNKYFTQFVFIEDQDIYYLLCKDNLGNSERKVCELRLTRQDKLPVWVHLVTSTFLKSTSSTEYRVVISDITDRKKVEGALKQSEQQRINQLKTANEELELAVEQRTRELQETQKYLLHSAKLAAIGKLSASIAHEFNNPLQGIMSVLKGLRKRAILEEEDSELLNEAIGESERIRQLIWNLQEFNKPSSGKEVLTDLHRILDSILLLNKSYFHNKKISVNRNYEEDLPQVLTVPDQIKQVFLNLLINAGDACLENGGVITVSTSLGKDGVAVAIKDTGIGIEADKMAQIFQPFYSTKPEVKGTGLGLSVSHGIIQHHRGEILVNSQPGQGATFTVLLPTQGSRGNAP